MLGIIPSDSRFVFWQVKEVLKKMKEVLSLFIFILLLHLALSGCIKGTLEFEIIPSGGKIAFESERDGNFEVYIMNSDCSNQINLTNNEGRDTFPTFSHN